MSIVLNIRIIECGISLASDFHIEHQSVASIYLLLRTHILDPFPVEAP